MIMTIGRDVTISHSKSDTAEDINQRVRDEVRRDIEEMVRSDKGSSQEEKDSFMRDFDRANGDKK